MTNTAPPKWRQFLGALTLLHVLALGGQALEARAQEPAPPDPPEAAPSEEGAALSYDVAFEGLDDKPELTALLSKTGLLFTLQDRGVETLGALRRRAEGDAPRLKQALNSEGYFGATLNYRLDEPADGPPKVTIKVTPGTRYTLGEYRVINRTPEAETGILTPDLGSLGLDLGQPARGPEIAAAQNKLIRRLNEGGFPDAQVIDRKAYVDHDKKELYIDLTIESGLAARLGEARFEGLESIDEGYLRNLLAWEAGELYDVRKLDETERELMATELFSSAVLEVGSPSESEERLPVTVKVSERAKRTIGFNLRFDSIDGLGGGAYWRHRNLFGGGERFSTALDLSFDRQSWDNRLRLPYFAGSDQTGIGEFDLSHEDTDAYESYQATSFAGLETELDDYWTFRYGGSLEYEQSRDARNADEREFYIVGAPLDLSYDGTDSLLDPTSGQRLELLGTPYVATGEDTFPFLRGQVIGSTYHSFDDAGRYVAALRGRFGSVLGASATNLPTSKRFYAGGGGSVRGFEYQSIGPLDASDDPLGGLSVVELNAELRLRVTDTIGVVPFIDGGLVSEDAVPTGDNGFLWAAGLGLRYYTALGPVRLDVAVPLNGRGRDDDFAFYISIGQAF